jgi:hypothetical protein
MQRFGCDSESSRGQTRYSWPTTLNPDAALQGFSQLNTPGPSSRSPNDSSLKIVVVAGVPRAKPQGEGNCTTRYQIFFCKVFDRIERCDDRGPRSGVYAPTSVERCSREGHSVEDLITASFRKFITMQSKIFSRHAWTVWRPSWSSKILDMAKLFTRTISSSQSSLYLNLFQLRYIDFNSRSYGKSTNWQTHGMAPHLTK